MRRRVYFWSVSRVVRPKHAKDFPSVLTLRVGRYYQTPFGKSVCRVRRWRLQMSSDAGLRTTGSNPLPINMQQQASAFVNTLFPQSVIYDPELFSRWVGRPFEH